MTTAQHMVQMSTLTDEKFDELEARIASMPLPHPAMAQAVAAERARRDRLAETTAH